MFNPELQKQVNALSKKLRCLGRVLYSDGPLSGSAGCYILGIDNSTGDIYYKNDSGNWELVSSGTSFDSTVDFSVNTNPNDIGTTFSPNTPELTTSIYVSTIDNSQWTWNGTNYVIYNFAYWSKTGNANTDPLNNFIGTTDGVDLLINNKRSTNGTGAKITVKGGDGVGVFPAVRGGDLYLVGGDSTGVALGGDIYIGGGYGPTDGGNVIMGFADGVIGGQVSKVGIGTAPNYLLDVVADAGGVSAAEIYNINSDGAGLSVKVNNSVANRTLFKAGSGAGGATTRFEVTADGKVIMSSIPEYANRTAATGAGLTTGMLYSLPISGDNKVICIV